MKLRSLAACVAFAACTHAPASVAPAQVDFGKFADAYFAAVFARSPSRATRTGFHEGNDGRLEDFSRPAIDAQIADLHSMAEQVAQLRRSKLSFNDEIDALLIDNQIHSQLLDLETLR